jgi:hypothetical protein
MAILFASGHIADIILGILVLEAFAFLAYRRWTGHGFRLIALLPNMLAGGCLVLALRTALVGAGWTWTAVALGAAFVAHIWDVISRR